MPHDVVSGHVWCVWSRRVHVWTHQRAGLLSEARLRVCHPRVSPWALRCQHGQPEAEPSPSLPVKASFMKHRTSTMLVFTAATKGRMCICHAVQGISMGLVLVATLAVTGLASFEEC